MVDLTFALEFGLGFLLVHSGFALGLFSTGIYSLLVISSEFCCSLAFTLSLLACIPNLLLQDFLLVFSWFAPGSFRVCSGSILY